MAICDIMELNDELKESIVSDKLFMAELRKSGYKRDKSNLHKKGVKLVLSGITSFEEIKRVVG